MPADRVATDRDRRSADARHDLVTRGDHLTALLLEAARASGLDACGICSARPFDEAEQSLQDGLLAGRAGGMQFTYRNPRRSTHAAVSMPWARALFVGAKGYARTPRRLDEPADNRPKGAVAMYSWTDHYSELRAALARVAEVLERAGWKAEVVVDDNALVDRAAAVRAGLGWYGKNTNVLLPHHGSWFVLGSVVTDAPIEGAEPRPVPRDAPEPTLTPGPVEDGCGSCRRCIDACPTGALDGSGHLDARLCLAWLLQAPGIFPKELRVAAGTRIYGCDDCQESCPVNRIALRRDPPGPVEEGAEDLVDVLALLDAGDDDLIGQYGRWYIPERNPSYLRRNALIALGNGGDPGSPEVASALANAMRHPDPVVRAHAVWAAARLGRRELVDLAAGDDHPYVVGEIQAAGSVPAREAVVRP